MRGISKVLMAGVLATSLGVAAMSAPAGAAAAQAVCKKATFKSTASKSTSQLSSCTKGPATAATLTATFPSLSNIKVTITWKSGGGKNGPFKITEKAGAASANKCKLTKGKKDGLIVSTGTVTSGTGKAASLKGTKFSESLCVRPDVSTYLMPGTTVKI